MHRPLYCDQVTWFPLAHAIKSLWELHSHTMYNWICTKLESRPTMEPKNLAMCFERTSLWCSI